MSNNKQSNSILQEKDTNCYQTIANPQDLIKEIEKMPHTELAMLNYEIAVSGNERRITLNQDKVAKTLGFSRWSANVAAKKLHEKGIVHKTYRYKLPCHYTINPLFRMDEVRKLLHHLLPALWKAPLFLLVSVAMVRAHIKLQSGYPTLNVNNSSLPIFEKNRNETAAHKGAGLIEEICPISGAEGTGIGAVAPQESPVWWDWHSGLRCPDAESAQYSSYLKKLDKKNEEIMKAIKEAAMINPIKPSIVEVTSLLNLNKVGQIRLMGFDDRALSHASRQTKKKKDFTGSKWHYFFKVCQLWSKDNNIEYDQSAVDLLLDAYGLSVEHEPTGTTRGITSFDGEPLGAPSKSPEKGRLDNRQQAASRRPAQEQHSATDFRMSKVDELTEARDFLEQCTYNPNTTLMPMPNHLKELLNKAKQLANEGKISIRPKSVWIEAIQPKPEEFASKDIYTARLRSWMELKAKVMDDQTMVTFLDEGEIQSRVIQKEQPKETLSTRVNDIGTILGSLFKQGSTSIIKEVLSTPNTMTPKNKDLSSQVNCIVIPAEYAKVPTSEECIPVVNHQMLDSMNLKPEYISPDLSGIDKSETIDEYVGRISGYFDLEEVYD